MEFIGGLFIIYLCYWVFGGGMKKQQREVAQKEYQDSLSKLRSDPKNINLKLGTLALGRKYMELALDDKGNTAFTENALMNDIDIACAAAAPSATPTTAPEQPHSPSQSIETRLQTLTDGFVAQIGYTGC